MHDIGYYTFFVKVSNIIKMKPYLIRCNIKPQNFSSYINYQNFGAIDNSKLSDLYYSIVSDLTNILHENVE